jgi:hypothetical protein
LTTAIAPLPINALDIFIIIRGSCSLIGGEQKEGPEEPKNDKGAVPFLSAALIPRLAKSERLSVELGGKGRNGASGPIPVTKAERPQSVSKAVLCRSVKPRRLFVSVL